MAGGAPKAPDRGYVYLRYVGHIAFLTGRTKEAFPLPAKQTIGALVVGLNEKYPGFKSLFHPPGGFFNSQSGILLRRAGHPTLAVNEEVQEIYAGDLITLW